MLGLAPHPEKGHFAEMHRDKHINSDGKSHGTCIYYLLEGESGLSHWHRVLDGTEIWHWYAGAPMRLSLSWDDGKPARDHILGSDLWQVSSRRRELQCRHAAAAVAVLRKPAEAHSPALLSHTGTTASGRSRCGRVAACAESWGLDAGRMHSLTSLHDGVLRNGGRRMGTSRRYRRG